VNEYYRSKDEILQKKAIVTFSKRFFSRTC